MPGSAPALWFFDNLIRIWVSGQETEGRYAVIDVTAPQGHMPPLHIHHREDETFVLLEGEVTLYVGDAVAPLVPGGSVLGPKGVPHTFRVESETARWLVVCTPAGFEGLVAALGQPAVDPATLPTTMPDPARLAALAPEYGLEILGPPGTLP